MDWTEFQLLYWFFKKSDKVLYIGTPELLEFAVANSKETYYVSPEKIIMKHPRLKKFEENPELFDLSRLPKKLDRIVNYLPLNLMTSFKVIGKYIELLEHGQNILIKANVPRKQMQYMDMIIQDIFPEFKLIFVSYIEIEGQKYILGKKL